MWRWCVSRWRCRGVGCRVLGVSWGRAGGSMARRAGQQPQRAAADRCGLAGRQLSRLPAISSPAGHPRDRAQQRAGAVGAQRLDVVKALATDQLGLGQRDHQLAARDAAAPPLDQRGTALGRQFGVDELNQRVRRASSPTQTSPANGVRRSSSRKTRCVQRRCQRKRPSPLGDLHSHPRGRLRTPPRSRTSRTETPATSGVFRLRTRSRLRPHATPSAPYSWM